MGSKIIVIFIILILVAVGYFGYTHYFLNNADNNQENIGCATEAKICPDGSAVGRTGPDCEFALCPDETADWLVYRNDEYNFSLSYPDDFFDSNQQPKLLSGDCNYDVFPSQCPNINRIVAKDLSSAGGDISAIENNLSSSGYWDVKGQQEIIDDVPYCLYAVGDAATGHVFNYYYYATVKDKKCLVVSLVAATENCDFYLPLEPGNTEQEDNYTRCAEKSASQPILLKQIISTFKFK